jgi:transposase
VFFANLPRCLIGLEACGGAHYWARELQALGHDARLMPPQYVKAYVKTNKHDAADAEACCEAVQRPSMRFVPVKSADQQATCMLHRVRDQLIGQRAATINARRGHLAELGIVAAQRQAGLRQLLATLGELEEERIPPLAREILQTLAAHLRDLEAKIATLDRRLVALARSDPVCRQLAAVPGVGPVIATAFAATVPDATSFRSGRHLAAWLGLVPGQHASGGKERPRGLSKRGDAYLRRQLITAPAPWSRSVPGAPASCGRGSTACGRAGRSTSWSRRWPTSWRASFGRCSAVASSTAPHDTAGPATPSSTSCEGNVDVMADRSDRGRHNPRWSTSVELVRMIGRRPADLIEASGQQPHPKAVWMAAANTALPDASKKPLQAGGVHG